jgi:hypothetical protein
LAALDEVLYMPEWLKAKDREQERNLLQPALVIVQLYVEETSYTFDFVGAQPGRWRVSAVDFAQPKRRVLRLLIFQVPKVSLPLKLSRRVTLLFAV